jgi:hypothetical protein
MFGGGPSNLVWFQLGKWSEETSRLDREAADALLGQGPIHAHRSYINELHAALQESRDLADHNFKVGSQFKVEAEGLRMLLKDRETIIKKCDQTIALYEDASRQDRAEYNKTNNTLHKLLMITGTLSRAEKAGKAATSEYKELTLLRDEMLAIISRQGSFDRFPEETHARYIFLIRTLDP